MIQLFLGLQDQMDELTTQTQALNHKMQLMMKQISDRTPKSGKAREAFTYALN